MDVLPAGPLPPNPTDLIESQPMAEIVGQAESEYDLVVIDTPPTSVVSDAIPLVVMVGGVIVVARIGKTTRQTFLKLQSQLANIGAPVLGAVANSLDRGTEDEYGYGYGYGHRNGRAGEPALSRQPVVGR